jgi:flagellar biosynthesis/type III secretory pathway M-ring protein FliF/YscJ
VPEAQASALADAVAASVGFDADRGDAIVMSRVPFDRTVIAAATESFAAAEGSQTILTYARIALPVIVLLVAFFFFRMLMKSVSRRGYAMSDMPDYGMALPAGMGAMGGMLPAGAAVAMLEEPPTPDEMKSDLERQVNKLAESHPDTVAEVVQSWLRED